VITLTKETAVGTYRIAANVYSYNNEATCDTADGDECRFRGGETVSFYGSRAPKPSDPGQEAAPQAFIGLLARAVMPTSKAASEAAQAYSPNTAHSWWLAGKSERGPCIGTGDVDAACVTRACPLAISDSYYTLKLRVEYSARHT